jgi:hypothetical protein
MNATQWAITYLFSVVLVCGVVWERLGWQEAKETLALITLAFFWLMLGTWLIAWAW